MQERWDAAVAAVVIAGILDALDGRIARLLKGESRFGAELELVVRCNFIRGNACAHSLQLGIATYAALWLDNFDILRALRRIAACAVQCADRQ